jgi:hypothetical protein
MLGNMSENVIREKPVLITHLITIMKPAIYPGDRDEALGHASSEKGFFFSRMEKAIKITKEINCYVYSTIFSFVK